MRFVLRSGIPSRQTAGGHRTIVSLDYRNDLHILKMRKSIAVPKLGRMANDLPKCRVGKYR